MKKHIIPILLLISTYLFLFIIKLGPEKLSLNLSTLFLVLLFAVLIPNMIYPFILAKHEDNSSVLLFWDMVLKLCNIPMYVMNFIIGFIIVFFPVGFPVTLAIIVFNYILLLSTSMYGVSGLLKARREKKISKLTSVVNIILHFFFCADVISAIIMFRAVKAKERNNLE